MSPGGGADDFVPGVAVGSNFGVSVPVRASRSAVSESFSAPAGRSSSIVTPHSFFVFFPSTTTTPAAFAMPSRC